MQQKALLRLAQKSGYKVLRQTGSHVFLENAEKERLQITVNGDGPADKTEEKVVLTKLGLPTNKHNNKPKGLNMKKKTEIVKCG
jgi:predicted RNA binding protein YcfA (HicA-like mRNA interferase family)